MNRNILTKNTEFKVSLADSLGANIRGKAISLLDRQDGRHYVSNKKLHDSNFAFFTSTLGKLSTQIAEPLYNITYLKDIDIEYGGGFVDYSFYNTVNYSGLMGEENRAITPNNANYLPRVNASLGQEITPVHTYQIAYDLRFIDLEKMKKLELQKSIQDIYNLAILASWDLYVQRVAYLGENGGDGLFTSSKVVPATISTGEGGFEALTDAQVVAFFNTIFSTYLTGTGMNVNLLPDTFLVPSVVGRNLSSRFSPLYTKSLRNYIIEHNLTVDESNGAIPKLTIATRPELDNLGTLGKGRIVAYKKDKQFVRMDIPFPIQHFMTQPNIEKMSYTTVFVGQVGGIQLPYNNKNEFGVVTYWDLTN